jgi:hypothetical protein
VAQHDPQHVRPATLPIRGHDWCAAPKIDLGFLASTAFETTEREFVPHFETIDESPHAVVTAGEVVLGDQILMDALGAQAQIELGPDRGPPRFAVAGTTGVRNRLTIERGGTDRGGTDGVR